MADVGSPIIITDSIMASDENFVGLDQSSREGNDGVDTPGRGRTNWIPMRSLIVVVIFAPLRAP